MMGQEHLDVADRERVGTAREQRLEPVLLRLETELVQTDGLRDERRMIRQVGEGGAAPERERLFERRDGDRRILVRVSTSARDELVKPRRVELGRVQREPIPGGAGS